VGGCQGDRSLKSAVLSAFSPILAYRQPEDRGDGFGILDRSAQDHVHGFRKREEMLFDDFVLFRLGRTRLKTARPEDCHGFGDESGAGVEVQDALPGAGGVAGFFQQFALGGGQALLAFVDAAGRKLPKVLIGGVAILSLEEHARFAGPVLRGEHNDGASVADDVAESENAGGLFHSVGGDPENRAAVDKLAGEKAGSLSLDLAFGFAIARASRRTRASGFCHANNIRDRV
jgi:hypothetical protein